MVFCGASALGCISGVYEGRFLMDIEMLRAVNDSVITAFLLWVLILINS